MEYNKSNLQTGLTLVRAGIVLTFLGAMALTVPALKIPILARIVQAMPLLFVAGQVMCLAAPEEVNKNWIYLSLATIGFSYTILYIPAVALLVSRGMMTVLGLLGLILMGMVSVLLQLLATLFFLLFLRGLAKHYDSDEMAAQFLRLILVPIGAFVLAIACAKLLPANFASVIVIGAGVLGVAIIIAFSGAVGRLSGLVQEAA